MVESAPRFARLRTGETTPGANTTECLGYGDGGNGRWRQLQQPEKLSKMEIGSPRNPFPTGFSVGSRTRWRPKHQPEQISNWRNRALGTGDPGARLALLYPERSTGRSSLRTGPRTSASLIAGLPTDLRNGVRGCVYFAASSKTGRRHARRRWSWSVYLRGVALAFPT